MKKKFTIKDFEKLSWHDDSLYGVAWHSEFESGKSDLILDIDHICEWICDKKSRTCRFRVSPATLTFHNVTGLKIDIGWQDSGFQCCPHKIGMLKITKEPVQEQKVCLDRPYFKWILELDNLEIPKRQSSILFGASDFTLFLRKEPRLIEEQSLSLKQRN